MKAPKLITLGTCGAAVAVAFSLQPAGTPSARAEDGASAPDKPIKALMFTGGCCHDYDKQKLILSTGISERANVEWEIVHEGGKGTKYEYPLLKEDGWEKGYDVVLYNICAAKVTNGDYVDEIVDVHKKGVPAMAIHCTMHSHHWEVDTDEWEKFLGFTSPRHGKHAPITVSNLKPEHPVMKGFPKEWVTPKGELYHQEKLWPSATLLGEGTIDGGRTKHGCIWVNEYGKARVFGTTLGHHNETMLEETYLDLVTRGLLWVTGNL